MSTEDLEKRRLARLRAFAITRALDRFSEDYPGFKPEETVASICAYEEEGNIGDVLAKMPSTIEGDAYTTLVADGQNDPTEIPLILAPLKGDEADFVVASRVLGEDKTVDVVRKSGVRFFSFVMNHMTGANLTDTSTGYRALRVTMLADVIDRLTQEQYQTAELLITCLKRGWRASEVPTVWYPRASGTTKKGKNWLFGFRYARVVFGTWWRER